MTLIRAILLWAIDQPQSAAAWCHLGRSRICRSRSRWVALAQSQRRCTARGWLLHFRPDQALAGGPGGGGIGVV